MKKIDSATITLVIALLEFGNMSLREVCTELDLVYANVYWRVKKIRPDLISRKNNGKSKSTLTARYNSRQFSDVDVIRQYLYEMKSLTQIADIHGVSTPAISIRLNQLGVQTRLNNGRDTITDTKIDIDQLKRHYVDQQLSMQEISDLYPTIYNNHGNVAYDMLKSNIQSRTYKEAGKLLYQKRPEKRELHRKQFYDRVRNGQLFNKVTWIERVFSEWCTLNNIPYIYNFQFNEHTHRYDYWIMGTNLLIELDGDYWHSSDWAKSRDARVDREAEALGYLVIRITESDILKQDDPFSKVHTAIRKYNGEYI